MDGDYKHMIDEVFIIDSRYPYEYEGGHVKVQFCYMHVVVVLPVYRESTWSREVRIFDVEK